MSPYLFLLCAEGLSSLLKFTGPQFLAKGVQVVIHAPWVSHLLFADEYLVFTQSSDRGGRHLAGILDSYQKGSSQMVNLAKSAIFFSTNCDDTMKGGDETNYRYHYISFGGEVPWAPYCSGT